MGLPAGPVALTVTGWPPESESGSDTDFHLTTEREGKTVREGEREGGRERK